jgi:hypothetical protein
MASLFRFAFIAAVSAAFTTGATAEYSMRSSDSVAVAALGPAKHSGVRSKVGTVQTSKQRRAPTPETSSIPLRLAPYGFTLA